MENLKGTRICTDGSQLLALPYMQRQLLVVTDDVAIRAELNSRELAARARAAADEARRQAAVQKAAERKLAAQQKSGLFSAVTQLRIPEVNINLATLPVIDGVLGALSDNSAKVDALIVGSTLASCLRFPAGHPRTGVLYIGHPTLPGTYYTAANFHRLTFEHKFSEALMLLMSLGATSLTVERVSGWSREVAASAGASFGLVEASGNHHQSADARILFEASLDGIREPVLPPGLVWYPYEPAWQAIANGRLRFGIKTFKLTIEYNDDFSVDTRLCAKAGEIGLDLGGKFTTFEATTWNMSGVFPE